MTVSAIGLILQLSYRLRRHFVLGWSLARWLGLLFFAAVVGTLLRWWSYPWPAMGLAGVLLVYILVLAWADRQGYVRFVAIVEAESLLGNNPSPSPLRKEELVQIRASGWFTVEGQDRYYVDIEADFETVGTREHIVLGRVHPSRFLLLGEWPEEELGWWYIFFKPTMIQEVRLGHLHFGARPRPAVRVIYAPREDVRHKVCLTFNDNLAMRRVWEDLLLEAPAGTSRQTLAGASPKLLVPGSERRSLRYDLPDLRA